MLGEIVLYEMLFQFDGIFDLFLLVTITIKHNVNLMKIIGIFADLAEKSYRGVKTGCKDCDHLNVTYSYLDQLEDTLVSTLFKDI